MALKQTTFVAGLCEVLARGPWFPHILVTASMARAERSHSSGAMVIW